MTTPAPIQPIELTDLLDAQIVAMSTMKYNLITPFAGVKFWDMILVPCLCPGRVLYHAHLANARDHFFLHCPEHGLSDCGLALRADRMGLDDERQQRRRKSGYTTTKWYHVRGM